MPMHGLDLFIYQTKKKLVHTKICPFPGKETTLGSKPLRSLSLSGRTLNINFK